MTEHQRPATISTKANSVAISVAVAVSTRGVRGEDRPARGCRGRGGGGRGGDEPFRGVEKEGFQSEEEATETGWLEVNAAVKDDPEKESGQPEVDSVTPPPPATHPHLPIHLLFAPSDSPLCFTGGPLLIPGSLDEIQGHGLGQRASCRPSSKSVARPAADALPARHVLALRRHPRAPHPSGRPWRKRFFSQPSRATDSGEGRPVALCPESVARRTTHHYSPRDALPVHRTLYVGRGGGCFLVNRRPTRSGPTPDGILPSPPRTPRFGLRLFVPPRHQTPRALRSRRAAPSPGTAPSPIVAGDGLPGARSSPRPTSASLSPAVGPLPPPRAALLAPLPAYTPHAPQTHR